MEFRDVIAKRRMVRAFTGEPIDPEAVRRILAAANRGPSAGFSQGYALLALQGPEQTGPLWEIVNSGAASDAPADQPGSDSARAALMRAPLVVVPLSCKDVYLDRYARTDKGWTDRDESRWPVPYWHIDTGFTALLMLLATVDEGLGALFFGIQPHLIDRFRESYGVPSAYLPIGAVAIGYPDRAADPGGSAKVIKRRSLDDVVHHGRW